jgi:endonuclease G
MRYPWLLIPVLAIALVVGVFILLRGGRDTFPRPAPPAPAGSQREDESTDREREAPPTPAVPSVHLTMGNPSGATPSEANPDNYLMVKQYLALSYNDTKGTPNWVSWCLKASDLGNAPRWPQFYPDDELPRGFKRVKPSNYNGSGFDRGHMCPSADRSTEESAKATFVMTNIIPQSPACNQHAWADLEDYCRDLVRKRHKTLYIVAGPQGQGGEGKEGPKDVIGHAEKVTVPANCWKVVLALDEGVGDASDVKRVSRDSRVFAVRMRNDMLVEHGWAQYRVSVKEVEELTGYRFFDRVPAAVIGPLKEQVDREHIPPVRPRRSGD